jgi:hypothetical protein
MFARCVLCDADSPLLHQEPPTPICMNILHHTRADALQAAQAALSFNFCSGCGLLFQRNGERLLHFDARYNAEQSHSAVYGRHLEALSREFASASKITEIGCGKGSLLELLQQKNIQVRGFDSSYDGGSPFIQREPFEHQSLDADLIILRHVLDEVPEPFLFLRSISEANQHQGEVYIEVIDLSACTLLDLCYERVSYFSAQALLGIFSLSQCRFIFSGQYLSLRARLASLRRPSPRAPLPAPSFDYAALGAQLREPCVVWGASNKGGRLANLYDKDGSRIRYFVDLNPQKQGMFIPGTGHRIVSPKEASEDRGLKRVLVVNPIYLEEVRQQLQRPDVQCLPLSVSA